MHYVWLLWSSAFLLPWLFLFIFFPEQRGIMVRISFITAPFGLTEPVFVPEYWNPPSLFNLAQTTGFDLESIIFCFAIGGVGAVLYNTITGRKPVPVELHEEHNHRHRFHMYAVLSPIAVFLALYFLPWNPIYPAIVAMLAGAAATVACRPDLKIKTIIGGGLFLAYYAVFMLALTWLAPGYIEAVWNLKALSQVTVAGVPVEELLFGFSFGMYWTGAYEHIAWKK
ncbi:MAG: hypothetical protein B7Y56_10690 [Gallionellales bacterium 35-53-114]|jgi:hypothetical protein|nr:MAG: hypothetical protein B7Y56_10690 [Gallionellales bacterium 35-53-114]OYZ64908.1 MAG: hypothetical protein B7Y04_03910 [Gallionellales bacterium 24-53-125]OZB07554.1 MAG: hypothetical protein B7X61_13105 [Gallionellales bacterium 39-52-133]